MPVEADYERAGGNLRFHRRTTIGTLIGQVAARRGSRQGASRVLCRALDRTAGRAPACLCRPSSYRRRRPAQRGGRLWVNRQALHTDSWQVGNFAQALSHLTLIGAAYAIAAAEADADATEWQWSHGPNRWR